MRRLYLDCDGVILDTINKSYKIFEEKNIPDGPERQKYYANADWNELIALSGEINDSVSKIKVLSEHFDIKILTHVHSEKEGEAKNNYFMKHLPGIEVIIVPKGTEKSKVVNPEGAILVDDFYPNLKKWEENGGIGVKFSDSGKKYDCITITDLLDLLEINFDNRLIKIKE